MNQMRDFASNAASLEARLGLLIHRLTLEVTRLRALRGDGRHEAFAGLLLRDADIAALCAEMAGVDLPDLTGAEGQLAQAEAEFAARHRPDRLSRLAGLYDLDAVEEGLLVLALAPAVDPRFGRVYGFLVEDMAQQHLTPALAQRLLPGGGIEALRDALAPDARLPRHGLLRLSGEVWVTAKVEMPEAILRLILTDHVVPPGVVVLPLPGIPGRADRPRLVQFGHQSDPVIGGGFRGTLWVSQGQGLDAAREVGVAAAMAGAGIAYAGWDDATVADRQTLAASLGCHAAILTARPDLWDGAGCGFVHHDCPVTTHVARLEFWQGLTPAFAEILATCRLGVGLSWRLATEAVVDADPAARLAAMIRGRKSAPMLGLADPVACPHDLDDLILPEPMKARLRGFARRQGSAAQVLEDWGLGGSFAGRPGGIALFTGPSGVGKTMAAGVVARLAGLDLMRINLATVVSKYIGETEANLERIFTAAAASEVILFFDEAEALFSKRADVKDARDRYANMEMSYLLQRLESFQGMAILASNMGNTLDPALLRRFDLVLEFALPDAAARRAIWGKLSATRVPLARDVDLDALAEQFDLAGGHIRQAILSAAHEAAQNGGVVTQAVLVQGVAREYAKLGRTLRREDFGAAYVQVRGG